MHWWSMSKTLDRDIFFISLSFELLISSSELQALLPQGVLKKAISVIKDLPEKDNKCYQRFAQRIIYYTGLS